MLGKVTSPPETEDAVPIPGQATSVSPWYVEGRLAVEIVWLAAVESTVKAFVVGHVIFTVVSVPVVAAFATTRILAVVVFAAIPAPTLSSLIDASVKVAACALAWKKYGAKPRTTKRREIKTDVILNISLCFILNEYILNYYI